MNRIAAATGALFLFLWICLQPKNAADSIREAVALCGGTLIPALFPYLVLTKFLIGSGCADAFSRRLGWMTKPFRLSHNCASAILLGAVSGYPAGANTIAELYTAGRIKKQEAEALLCFSCNAGPAFFLSVIGGALYHSRVGFSLLLIHLAAAFCCGLLNTGRTLTLSNSPSAAAPPAESISSVLIDAVESAGETMLRICFFVLSFSQILAVAQAVFMQMPLLYALTAGICELSSGIVLLAAQPMNWQLKYCLNAFFLGFGGLCVAAQTASILQKANLPVKRYLCGKLLHGLVSAVMAFPVSYFISPVQETGAIPYPVQYLSPWPWCLLPVGLIFLIFLQFPSRNFPRNGL